MLTFRSTHNLCVIDNDSCIRFNHFETDYKHIFVRQGELVFLPKGESKIIFYYLGNTPTDADKKIGIILTRFRWDFPNYSIFGFYLLTEDGLLAIMLD